MHILRGLIGIGTGLFECIADGDDAQDSSAAGHGIAVLVKGGACVIAAILCLSVELVQTGDDLALLVALRIAAGGNDNTDCRIVIELQIDLIQSAVDAGLHHINDIRLHAGQDDLGLGIAESGVVLKDAGAVGGHHEAEIEDTAERTSLRRHGRHGLVVNILTAPGIDLGGVEGAGGEGSHTACVEAGVAVSLALVVLGGSHQLIVGAVHKREHGDLAACHELFDDDAVSGIAELFVHHQFADTVLCGSQVFADQNALAQSQSGCLENDGERGCLQISQCLVRIVKSLVSSCRNAVFFHQILGKSLASLDDGRIGGGSENAQSLCLKGIHDARAERIVHAADSEVDLLLLRKSGQGRKVHGPDRDTLGDARNAGISGSAVQLRNASAAQDRVRDRVFSSAAAYQQHFHVHFLLCQVFFLLRNPLVKSLSASAMPSAGAASFSYKPRTAETAARAAPSALLVSVFLYGICLLHGICFLHKTAKSPSSHENQEILVLRPSILTLPAAIRSMARGRMTHSACSMTRRCSVSGVSSSMMSTAFCRMIGPVSRFSSTKCTVAPVTLTPRSRAFSWTCRP